MNRIPVHLQLTIRDTSRIAALVVCFAVVVETADSADERLPNIIFILADDLGYGQLGCYGQTVIETPRLDQLAADGMRFTQFYAGATVCAPSRCVLMTGRHTGHARVRGNGPARISSLRDADVTVAEVLKTAGYSTALCGKWGLGATGRNNQGRPNDQGFDFFYGYLNQTHAHNYYPEFLWRNTKREALPNEVTRPNPQSPGGWATKKSAYSPDLVTDEALQFVEAHRDQPCFLFWSMTLPHANNEARAAFDDGNEVPALGDYANRDWPVPDKGHAAMITRLDSDVGRLLDLLERLDIADNTLIMFSSDNGPHREGGQDPARFQPAGPLRGFKRDLYDGGIRVPFLARWPGKTPPGTTSDHIGYFGDVIATIAEISGQSIPSETDSISFLPTLLGKPGDQQQHEYLYWEFYEQGTKQAVRAGQWKAVRMPMRTGVTELYDLQADPAERRNIAADHPEIVRRLEEFMDQAHVPDPNWQR